MKPFPPLAWVAAAALAAFATAAPAQSPGAAAAPAAAASAPRASALDAELFYEVLLGELHAQGEDPGTGIALMLDAARKTNDEALYRRAVEMALQARSADAALQAARTWKAAQPRSRDANRYMLQIAVAVGRLQESVELVKTEIALADPVERPATIAAVPRYFARVMDRKQAAATVEQALADYLDQPGTGAAAWTAVGRMRLAAGDEEGALEAARRGQAIDPQAEGPVLLALEMMEPKRPEAEALVKRYIGGEPRPEIRMGYARALLEARRYPEALEQLRVVTAQKPDFPEAWLVQGTLLVQDNHLAEGEAALKRYLELAQAPGAGAERERGIAQAYLSLAQVAEKRGDYAQATAWLDRIENAQDLMAAQNRRASILARQGRLEEARQLLRAVPERRPEDARAKLMAEVHLLREHKQYRAAHDLLAEAAAQDPDDGDLLYEQAMMAEKLGDFDGMERLLRRLIAAKPDFHHAYNALGYSFADRNVRLDEAKALIRKALEFAPGDPFITDSLGWVEYRLGNKEEARRILEQAYRTRPDPEIAAHLGEVLWNLGQRERAQAIWREGLLLGSDNETLQETLRRFKVQP